MASTQDKWFIRALWSYIPASIEGWSITAGGVMLILAASVLCSLIERITPGLNLDVARIAAFAVVLIGLLSIAKRHS